MPFTSQLRLYSYGIVTEDKEVSAQYKKGESIKEIFDKDRLIYATPIEISSYIDKELKRNETKVESKGVDADDQSYQVTLTSVNDVPALYLPLHGFASNIPHMKKGEKVLLWKFADEDEFYWTPIGTDPNLRRDDHHGLYVAATPDAGDELKIGINTYTHEVSPKKKIIESKTSKANGESNILHTTLDGAKGKTATGDDEGNEVTTDAKKKSVSMKNSAGTEISATAGQYKLENAATSLIGTEASIELTSPALVFNGQSALNGPVTIMAAPIDSYIKAVAWSLPPPINPALATAGMFGGNGGGKGGKGGGGTGLGGSRLGGGISATMGSGGPLGGAMLDDIVSANIGPSGGKTKGGSAKAALSPACGKLDMGINGRVSSNNTKLRGTLCGITKSISIPTSLDIDLDGFFNADFGSGFVDWFGKPVLPSFSLPKISKDLYLKAVAAASRLDCKITGDFSIAADAALGLDGILSGMPGDHNLLIIMCDDGEVVKGSNSLMDLLPGHRCICDD